MRSQLMESRIKSLQAQILKNVTLMESSLSPYGNIDLDYINLKFQDLTKAMATFNLGDHMRVISKAPTDYRVWVGAAKNVFSFATTNESGVAIPLARGMTKEIKLFLTMTLEKSVGLKILEDYKAKKVVESGIQFIERSILSGGNRSTSSYKPHGEAPSGFGIKVAMVGLIMLIVTVIIIAATKSDKVSSTFDSMIKSLIGSLKNVANGLLEGISNIASKITEPTAMLKAIGELILKVLTAPFKIATEIFKSFGDLKLEMSGIALAIGVIGVGLAIEWQTAKS